MQEISLEDFNSIVAINVTAVSYSIPRPIPLSSANPMFRLPSRSSALNTPSAL
jgi:hypothetical protein